MELSVVIPAYNEEKRLGQSLIKITDYFNTKKFDYEIIIVNDGSCDNTSNIVENFGDKRVNLLRNSKNMGKGFSVKRGMLAAKKRHVLFSDADLSTPIEELEKFIPYINDYDVLVGSRNLSNSDIRLKQPFIRSKLGRIFPILVNLFLLGGIKDTQCGFKLFRKETIVPIFSRQTLNDFGFDVEILFITKKLGFRIKEIPITWINSRGSKVRLLKDPIRMLLDIIQIRQNNKSGAYENNR